MKNQIENYALECKAFETVSAVHAGWYFEYLTFPPLAQMFSGFPLHTDEDGYMTLSAPRWGREENIGIPWLCVEKDFGDIVHGMLLSPENFHGKAVPATSDVLSFPDLTAAFQKGMIIHSFYRSLPIEYLLNVSFPSHGEKVAVPRVHSLGSIRRGDSFIR